MSEEPPPRSRVDAPPDPPEAPEIERRLSLYRWQAIGMLLIALIPVAALAGVFGDRYSNTSGSIGPLHVTAEMPAVFRYKTLNAISLHIRNDGAATIDTVHVRLDTAYIARFSTVNAVPPFDGAYSLALAPLPAGESSLVTIEIQAERYGRHAGSILVRAGRDSARITFTTTVLP